MPYFKDVKQLNNHIYQVVSATVDKIAEEIKDQIYDQVERNYISSLGGGYYQYEPTFQLLHSITKVRTVNTKNLIEIEVFFDTSKIKGTKTDTYWNQHMGMGGTTTTKKGNNIIESLPFWLEEGLSASTGTLYPREGWHTVADIYATYMCTFKDEIIRLLKVRYGIKAE